jgi:transcription elongation factor GreA
MVIDMAEDRIPMITARSGSHGEVADRNDGLLTEAEYEALVEELESLRTRHRRDVAARMRLARGFSDDDLLAVLEEAAVEQARIGRLEELVRTASVVDRPAATDGAAGHGTIVRVIDDAGRKSEYELVGRRTADSHRHAVSLSSPVGKALLGARTGDVVEAVLPSGRRRTLRILDVQPCQPVASGISVPRLAAAA